MTSLPASALQQVLSILQKSHLGPNLQADIIVVCIRCQLLATLAAEDGDMFDVEHLGVI